MRQRVALARALAVAPQLLLMDEPFAALDVDLRRRMQDLVSAEVRGAGQAVLLVTHDVAEAVRVATRIVVLSPRPGRIVADVANTPLDDPASLYLAAAELLRRAEIAAALFRDWGTASRRQ
jgi:NitT/TauT family transport system ATP-binding protein